MKSKGYCGLIGTRIIVREPPVYTPKNQNLFQIPVIISELEHSDRQMDTHGHFITHFLCSACNGCMKLLWNVTVKGLR